MGGRSNVASKRPIRQKGQSLVEFALLLPVLLLVIFGLLDMGRAVYTYTVLAHAAHEGARQAVIVDNTNQAVVDAALQTAVAVNLLASEVQILGTRQPGTQVTVTVSHPFAPVTPLIAQVVGNSLALSASATMIVD